MTKSNDTEKHTATWWVYAGDELIRHTAAMRGTWDYEVKCSCGYRTRTGGASRGACRDMLEAHRAEAAYDADRDDTGRAERAEDLAAADLGPEWDAWAHGTPFPGRSAS